MEFKDEGTRDVYHGDNTIAARRALPQELHEKAGRLLDRLNAAGAPTDLRTPRGNRLEKLSGDREGQWSIRINDQYRICFEWTSEAVNVEITDYH
ncbi:MAG: type II toxin-antitoxin system RelE/ParE family toxin [Candidatus Aquilonibacter sp.]